MTQQYTPVAWQDETTSQQGTLINAERLNQMQQAHHYADGLEEVDAIPTADPGVSYHKIVYCTADSTIYRWDGTAWTADIDDETKALLQQEIARATEAEGELAQDITDEATARETADAAMQADISDLGDAIEAEETARGQADTALGTRITNETAARETADTNLGNRITAEATARADADTALGGRIDTEQARAEAAEQANAQAIANTYTKAEADTLLALKADKATTLAGYGITDAYTKTEADTFLGTKANDNAVVHLAGAETIPGAKTFTANRGVALKATQSYNTFEVSSKGFTNNIEAKAYTSDGSAADQHFVIGTSYSDASREVWHAIAYAPRVTRGNTSEAQTEMRLSMNINNNNTGEAYFSFGRNDGVSAPDLILGKFANGTWTPTMVNDALDGYLPMVRTSGNQTIGGEKTFSNPIKGKFATTTILSTSGATDRWGLLGRVTSGSSRRTYIKIYAVRDNVREAIAKMAIFDITPVIVYQFKKGTEFLSFAITTDSEGNYDAWINYNSQYSAVRATIEYEESAGEFTVTNITMPESITFKRTTELQEYPTFTPAVYMEQVTQ